jgi:hypothetical protein
MEMSSNHQQRIRVFISGLSAATITSLLMFTVVESLSPQNLLRRDQADAEPVAVQASLQARRQAGV